MDPTNITPTEPNIATPDPVASAAPTSAAPANPAQTTSAAPALAVNPDVANAALNPPANPVVAPTAPVAPGAPVPPAPAAPASLASTPATPGMAPTMSMNQMFQQQPAGQTGVLDDMTPIAVPEGPKPVDPVEEELKAPLKPAEPVPGSIGSAVSGPQDANAPQNVAFNDPANNPMTANTAPQAKKNSIFDKLTAKTKMNKKTLIMLAVVAGIVVVLLVVVLVMVATGTL
ncbi:hypothetical protein IJI18_03525 [Candidatus Saccharibacteria bacterium]|nr:hypothetical protein [Candidatus Saccharibacteria bacterium]